jgi:hypothetical protein
MKAEACIDRCPDEVFKIVSDLELRTDYDETYAGGGILAKVAH